MAELSPQDVDELFGLREVLERFFVQIAAGTRTTSAAELADRLEAMRHAAATGAAVEQAEAHRQSMSRWWPWRATTALARSSPDAPESSPVTSM